MHAPHTFARSQLITLLGRRGPSSAVDLAQQLGVSVPTLHRLLQEHPGATLSAGKARRTRHALRRSARGVDTDLPLYEVDAAGSIGTLSRLTLVMPQGTCMPLAGTGWPVPPESADGWWDGLPYPLYDMAPQGYMGRQLARAEHEALRVDDDPQRWSDDDVAQVLSRIGDDLSGNLILGDIACERWMRGKAQPAEPASSRTLGRTYARLAEWAVAAGVRGSSAGGDFPKFAALRQLPGADTPHVLVKFSGADGSAAVRRWSDLLVCEHLALECVALLPAGVAASSRIVIHSGRTFLETERFDRHGLQGRSRLASLAMLNAALVGDASGDWTRVSARLAAADIASPGSVGAEVIAAGDIDRIQHLHWFGRLIANTDMHLGNLSFRPHGSGPHALTLAPAYDMLPMLYAPLAGGEVPQPRFEPALPLPPQTAVWHRACSVARVFWHRAAQDSRLSTAFRAVCTDNHARLQQVADRV